MRDPDARTGLTRVSMSHLHPPAVAVKRRLSWRETVCPQRNEAGSCVETTANYSCIPYAVGCPRRRAHTEIRAMPVSIMAQDAGSGMAVIIPTFPPSKLTR